MRKVLLLSLIVCMSFGCSTGSVKNETKDPSLKHYLAIKDALVSTDGQTVQSEAKQWLSELEANNMKTLVERMAATSDVRIHRENFNELSQLMIKRVGMNQPDITLYKQYCPMAFFNKGAYWLSTEEQVMNPYFGELMLTCGEVKEVIESND